MDKRHLQRLEYYKIIDMLADCTTFSLGREMAEGLGPSTDLDVILQMQAETSEAKNLLRLEPDIPMGGLRDIRRYLRKAVIGGVLEPAELMETADMLFATRRLKNFFKEKEQDYPIMSELVKEFAVQKDLEDSIKRAVGADGEILDTASPELKRIRSAIRNMQVAIKEKIEAMVRSSEIQKYLQESIVTMRGDRYVLAVKQEFRTHIPGIVHDQSASGATLFVEPMPAVEKGNELRRLQAEEQQEIIKILTRLTETVKVSHQELHDSVVAAGNLDFILAKGKLSHRMDGGEPSFNKNRHLRLLGARHPLLKGKAVPINVWLGQDFHIIVITGPNTGGKTVALKTVGLLSIMAQAGLHIPAETGAETCIFDEVFTDIGDEQSIEQSLSTFSSHMTNVVKILKRATQRSLVLLDELGAGTDPSEGAALAMAILDFLDQQKVTVIATTHYSELKAFAFNRPGVENASVEFDVKTLRPTYKLNIGQPGSSSAFDIAGRLGLSSQIIDVARNALSAEDVQVSELIRTLEQDRTKAERDRQEAEKIKKDIRNLKDTYEAKLKELNDRKAEMLDKARQEAAEVRRGARLEAEKLIEELKGLVAHGASQKELTEAHHIRKKLRQLGADEKETVFEAAGDTPKNLRKGQEVMVPRYNQQGIVLSAPDSDGNVLVQIGVMKMNLPITEVRTVKNKAVKKPAAETGAPKVMAEKAMNIGTEIDLRGLTVDEAIEMVEKYLDDAYLAGLPKAYVIHGKGTGALRSAITRLMSSHRYVKNFRLGEYGEGGAGVTVVELQ